MRSQKSYHLLALVTVIIVSLSCGTSTPSSITDTPLPFLPTKETSAESPEPKPTTPQSPGETSAKWALQMTGVWVGESAQNTWKRLAIPFELEKGHTGWQPFVINFDVRSGSDSWEPVSIQGGQMTDTGGFARQLSVYYGSSTGREITIPPQFSFRVTTYGTLPLNQQPSTVTLYVGSESFTFDLKGPGSWLISPLNESPRENSLSALSSWYSGSESWRFSPIYTVLQPYAAQSGIPRTDAFVGLTIENTGGYDLSTYSLASNNELEITGIDQNGYFHSIDGQGLSYSVPTIAPGLSSQITTKIELPGDPDYAYILIRAGVSKQRGDYHLFKVERTALATDSPIVTASNSNNMSIVGSLAGDFLYDTSVSLDGKTLAVVREPGIVWIYDIPALRLLSIIPHYSAHSVAVSPNGKLLAIRGYLEDPNIRILDIASNESLHTLDAKDLVVDMAWSPNGDKLIATVQYGASLQDHKVLMWDSQSGQPTILRNEGHLHSIAWSLDGSHLAFGSWDNTVEIWKSDTWEVLQVLQTDLCTQNCLISSVAWSPDSQKLAAGSNNGAIQTWAAIIWQKLHKLQGHSGIILSLSWSPDGMILASGGGYQDNALTLWNTETGSQLRQLIKYPEYNYIRNVEWLMEGRFLLTQVSETSNMIVLWGAR